MVLAVLVPSSALRAYVVSRGARPGRVRVVPNAADVARFFELFHAIPGAVTCYSQGVNQSSQGTDKVNAIINCHLATGRIGKPGMGPFSITGQPNAMGGREVGGLANLLSAHRDLANPLTPLRLTWEPAPAGG